MVLALEKSVSGLEVHVGRPAKVAYTTVTKSKVPEAKSVGFSHAIGGEVFVYFLMEFLPLVFFSVEVCV